MLSASCVWQLVVFFFHLAWRRQTSSFTDFRRLSQPLIQQFNLFQRFLIKFRSGLLKPGQMINTIVTIPIHSGCHNMRSGIVILKITWVQPTELSKHKKYTAIQNSAVGLRYWAYHEFVLRVSDQTRKKTSPNDNSPFVKLNCKHNTFQQKAFFWQTPDATIQVVEGELWFITQENLFPLPYNPLYYWHALHHLNWVMWSDLIIKGL